MPEGLKTWIKQEAPFESEAQEAALNLLVAASFMNERLERAAQKYDITRSQYNILRILRGAPADGYPRCEVHGRMIDRSPDVTRLMDRLVERGLVDRRRSDTDRRVALHTITDKGRALLLEMHPDISDTITFFASRVSQADLHHLSRICEGIYLERE
ncbi:MAG: winged helix DNA-binding protein [Rhodothermales bacterium]|nr:winged helix DNA-binding protein [Rhodothermales bacterium]